MAEYLNWGQWRDKLTEFFHYIIEFAAKNPKEFLVTFLLILSPLMLICGYLAYLMIKQIDGKEKSKKKKALKSSNTMKTRRKAAKIE
ncbi:small integral membrane protein 15 isoform X2 [Hydra vulgaris]|uniref:Small integral membrane protein 15 n=1 Tax=Hydra vulgaris TaxID=6087 RepID=A0ABM4C0P4_HYDVU